MQPSRSFPTRDAALRWLRARNENLAHWSLRLVPGFGYVLTALGFDPALATRRAA